MMDHTVLTIDAPCESVRNIWQSSDPKKRKSDGNMT